MSARVGQRHRDAAAIYKLQWLGDGSRVETVVAQAIADAERSGMERAAKVCESLDSCETDLGQTCCNERYAAAIRAAAQGE